MMEEVDFVESQSAKEVNKKSKNFKIVLIYLTVALILSAVLIFVSISFGKSSPVVLPETKPETAPPTGTSTASATKTVKERVYFTRDLFPGLFSIDHEGKDLKAHKLNSSYFIYLLNKSGDKIGFSREDEQEIGIYDIKTGKVQMIKFDGVFCDFKEEDGSKLLAYDHVNLILIDAATGKQETLIKPAHDRIANIKYSQDKKFIYYKSAGSLYKMDAKDGGNLIKIHDLVGSGVGSGLFSPDGKKYAYRVNNPTTTELYLFDFESETSEMVLSVANDSFAFISWSSDNINDIFLSYTVKDSRSTTVYKFNLKEKKLKPFEKTVKIKADSLKPGIARDSRAFLVPESKGDEQLCSVDGAIVEPVFDNSKSKLDISKISPLRYDSKVIFKANDTMMYDFSTKSIEVVMRAENNFAFSPSGKRVAIYTKKFEVFDLEKKVLVFSKTIPDISSYAFSHDCKSIFYIKLNGASYHLYKMDALTGDKEEEVMDWGPDKVEKLSMSPDGGRAALIRQDKTTSTLVSLDLSDLSATDLHIFERNSFSIISWHDNTRIYLEARDPVDKKYCLYEIDANDKKLDHVFNSTGERIIIKRI